MTKNMVAALMVAAGLVGSASAADLCSVASFECNGFEPNWRFVTTTDAAGDVVVEFLDPENPGWESGPLSVGGCVLQGSPNDFEVTGDAPVSLLASIVGQSCTEPNDEVTDFSVTVTYTQGALSSNPRTVQGTGCCRRLD